MTTINRTSSKVSAIADRLKEDERIWVVTLQNGDITVELTNIGCAIVAIHTPDKHGVQKNIVAGFSDPLQYLVNKDYYGVVVGRCANRIAGGNFELNGNSYQLSVNNGSNHLHGGEEGFSHKIWELCSVEHDENQCSAVFCYLSHDGEEGYPGNLSVKVTYTLNDTGSLQIRYEATADKSTPVNLTNHSYFNLTGFQDPVVLDHILTVNAASFTEKNGNNTPSGRIIPVHDTPLDFRQPKRVGDGISELPEDMGYDHNFVLTNNEVLSQAAVLEEKSTGRKLTVYTDAPGLQVYTANFWNGGTSGRQGVAYRQHGGIGLETQAFPDSVHHAHFPSVIVHPGEVYQSNTIFEFSICD